MNEIKIIEEKANLYGRLIEKYLHHSFKDDEEEQEFVSLLRNLLNENEDEVEFEVKISILNTLTAGIKLKKFDTITF